MHRPQSLSPGDLIGVAAPAGPILKKEPFQKGMQRLIDAGFRVTFERGIFSRQHYLAGTSQRRSRELLKLLKSRQVRGVVLARGGFGSLHLLPELHRQRRRLHPKIVMGYSDATALLLFLAGQLGWVTFHGPMLMKDLAGLQRRALQKSLALLEGKGDPELWAPGIKVLRSGKAVGPILGGCLSLIVALCGTPFQPKFRGKILFLEDTGEKFYQVDRMITQLKLAGLFEGVRGIVLGPFRHLGTGAAGFFKDLLSWFKGPIVMGFPSGHCPRPHILPFGVPAEFNTKRRRLLLLQMPTVPHV